MAAPEYSAKRAELAKTIGLGRKPGPRRKRAAGTTNAVTDPDANAIKTNAYPTAATPAV
jgi:hypothetical protein